jgi:Cu(I)/Ag(I) efflux system membrane protein CusA/SilA
VTRVVGVFVRFSCAASIYVLLVTPVVFEMTKLRIKTKGKIDIIDAKH